ncbi:hypothetical protein GCM10027277_52920 [Pseudoduganella ginsengisoli]|uniref:Uncharacterized protein n=1 Tax=Pseudoduganella ginsengisoli TaxID=1462440 RepID=A0A6L6Q0D8_9BURK|nr:hypothetical protein [Pseudoduganella ginsengisoli]MTW03287.1 hypothetical protein [Pseudoduganella ginsengisoli]
MKDADSAALAVAKERLVREGELYRVSVAHAKGQLAYALHPDALMHSAVDHAMGAMHHRFGSLFSGQHGGGLAGVAGLASGLSLPKILPYAIKAGSFIIRKRLIKPVLLAGVAAAIAGMWISHKHRH